MTAQRPNPGPGAHGFGERGEPSLALGSVLGVRVFDFGGSANSPFLRVPGGQRRGIAGVDREPGELAGQHGGSWADGENIAECVRDGQPTGHVPPQEGCGCGFWNYWQMDAARLVFSPERPVLAVIEGYGRTVIGERGFRCAKARIVALHVAFDFVACGPVLSGRGWNTVLTAPGTPHPDNDALKSECEQLLADRYPSARIYATQAAMLAMHPPTRDYLPAPAVPRTSPEQLAWGRQASATPVPVNAPPGSIGSGWVPVGPPAVPPSARAAARLANWPGRIIRMR